MTTTSATTATSATLDPARLTLLDTLSPFELQTELGVLAARSGAPVLDAGKGQPNWLATTSRYAFHLLGRFAVGEAERSATHPDAGWHIDPRGVADRLAGFLDDHRDEPGAGLLSDAVALGITRLELVPDVWVGELVDGILGDRYPSPHRALAHVERLLHEYLLATHCAEGAPPGRFRLFATEGGAAAMTYVTQSLRRNGVLERGDRIAVGVPIFTPYLQIPTLEEFGFDIVYLRAAEELGWRYPASELERLRDRSIKAFFLVNPGNPGTRALSADERRVLTDVVSEDRPDLIILVDTAYATFLDGFHSLLADLPRQTIGVHSFSKHFGATGSRLAFIAMHEDHVVDDLLRHQPDDDKALQAARYRSVTDTADKLAFVDRAVAESRDVALYHIAGLSTPQQVQMALHAAFVLGDAGRTYLQMTRDVLQGRLHTLLDPLGVPFPTDGDTHYYTLLDVLQLAELRHGKAFADWLLAYEHPLTFPIMLAERAGVVGLPGRGFEAPTWSVRISLANLPETAYPAIAKAVHTVLDELHSSYVARKTPASPAQEEAR
jgi:aspartate 4-decarboxylase